MWRNSERTKREIMPLVCNAKKIIIFDTETTGLGSNAKIIQFSAIRYVVANNLELKAEAKLDIYINPQEPLQDKIVEITGITDTVLKEAKVESEEVYRILSFLRSADVLAAYNSPFDIRMIQQMSNRTGVKVDLPPCVDILKMARDIIPVNTTENYSLSTITGYLFPDLQFQYHSSIEDVMATQKIFSYFLKSYCQLEERMNEKLQVKLEWASYNENPKQKSQKRIKLKLTVGEYGDIFWDVIKMAWSCKTTSKAKKLYQSVDLKNLEQQVLNRYGWKYQANDMDSLAKAWGKAKRKQAQ